MTGTVQEQAVRRVGTWRDDWPVAVVAAGSAALVWAGARLAGVDVAVRSGSGSREIGLVSVVVTAVVVTVAGGRAAARPGASYDEAACGSGPGSRWRSGSSPWPDRPVRGRVSAGLALTALHLVVGAVVIVGLRRRHADTRSVTAVRSRLGCSWQRNASVLVWTPVLLLGPVLDLHGSAGDVVFQVAMIVVIAASAGDRGPGRRAAVARPAGLRRPLHPGRRDLRRRHPRQQPVAAHLDPAGQRPGGRAPRALAAWSPFPWSRRRRCGPRGRSPRTRRAGCGPRASSCCWPGWRTPPSRPCSTRWPSSGVPGPSWPASRWPRSASASRATCTTCSATRCR